MAEQFGTVYLIHFNRKVAGHAQHYCGWALDVKARLACHKSGNGSKLMAEVGRIGIKWRLAATWEGSRNLERQLKNTHNLSRFCPICAKAKAKKGAAK